jgi:hypothetical protein
VRLAAVCGRADPPVHAYAEVAKKAAAAEAENKTSGDPAGDAEGAHQPIHRASRTGVCLAAVCGRADPQVHAYAVVVEDSVNFLDKYNLRYYTGGLGQSLKSAPVHVEHAPARDERTFEQYTGQDGFTVDVLFSAAPPLVGQLCATLKTTKTTKTKTKTTKTTETKTKTTKTTETKTKTTKITKRKREQVCTNCRALHQ